jgi:arylsulfatase A-like enzyme
MRGSGGRRLALRELGALAQSALVASAAALVFPSVALLALAKDSWAGASDDKVSAYGATTYAGYLREIGVMLGSVAATECAVLTLLTLGVLLLVHRRLERRFRRAWAAGGATLLVALLVLAVYVGFGMQRHPGLFLEAMSAHVSLQLWVESCAYLGPLALFASIAGYASALYRGDRRTIAVVLASACALGGGCGLVYRRASRFHAAPFQTPGVAPKEPLVSRHRPTAPRTPNILWIAVDSLRPDKIDPETTPSLSALLRDSVYFENAIVPVPRTGPSWAAAMTSLAPLTNGIETMFPSRASSDLRRIAMPAHLGDLGYRTLVTSEYAGEFFGRVDFGFRQGSVPRAELMQISGQVLLARAPLVLAHFGLAYSSSPWVRAQVPPKLLELVRGMPNFSQPSVLADDVLSELDAAREKKEPLFALAFYSQPHFPYTSSPAFGRRFHVAGSSASIRYGRDVASSQAITSEADRRQLDGLYRASLAESDAAIGRLLDALAARGVLDDTLVILSADHGEGLYELAECVGHGDNLRSMTTLRVPLAFRLPKRIFPRARPARVSAYVSTMDVYPTVLALLGAPPVVVHEGKALLGADGNPRGDVPARTLFVETGEWLWTTAAVPKDRLSYPPITEIARLEDDRIAIDPKYDPVIRAAKHRAAIHAPYKLVYEPSADGARYRLFDFVKDPLEERDLSTEEPEIAARLKEELRRDVLRHAFMLPVGEHFLTRPPMPADGHW